MASIRVFSGGAPKEVFLKLTPQFEKASGHKVTYVFEVMSSLKDRLAKGEVADVLVMPTNMLDSYEKDGVVRAHGRAILGLVPINAVVRSGAPLPDLSSREATTQSLLKARSISHATPGATPSGTHMGKLVEQLGIADAMKSKTIHRPALEGGVELVARGEAEIGFYPKSEVINIDGLTLAGPLPADIQLTTIYGAGVTAKSAAPDAAEAFIRFMTEGQVQPAWRHAGFDKAN
ncbi:MAG: substrate-binding domain-containing protein [Pseudolabrys sp.]|nr:substrate-binding domain-containing protein [Pseudolabrys sp.]